MQTNILKLAAPRLSHCIAVIAAIAADIEGLEQPSVEHRMLQMMARLGQIAGNVTGAPERTPQARAQLFDVKVQLFLLSASIQVARAEGAEYGEPLRSMLANQLASYADHADGLYSKGQGALVALRSMGYYIGKAMNELSFADVVRAEIEVHLHIGAMRMLLVPEDGEPHEEDWVTARLEKVVSAAREQLASGLLRQGHVHLV